MYKNIHEGGKENMTSEYKVKENGTYFPFHIIFLKSILISTHNKFKA